MNKIGLLGGMSWESTQSYYRIINQGVNAKLGGLHSAEMVLYSIDFAPIEQLQKLGDWDAMAKILINAAQSIEKAGADALLICTNTMHKVADQVAAEIDIPLLHIADATGEVLQQQGIHTVGLLGTAFTMEQEFYRERLQQKFGLEVLVPDTEARQTVHRIIYDELCAGKILSESKAAYLDIIHDLAQRGAQAVILGCTEIGLLVQQQDTEVKLLDTTAIHAEKAVAFAVTESPVNND
ncbi:aspartate/glutamate racemase family protein [Shewanella yunxiaonensis]|uniref:Aspartate/glutamate racemase family protein n=1 Tax=Shewanella yunxiaonensis TaxID=2829809 RepID=A0ABX7YWS0_9GAMM|nr:MULTISPECIES: aspartate/glutamate racemase family protein [Shewanella]MDF0535410.1 aspartate/glutamate racemase family protein [Shewanella sp. A32]QUN07213.1 aspartate/glutamate racemase family protein [Shewanella yunxiaonensis]